MDSEDYLQDCAFDYYGERMAVCSNDRKIKIFEKSGDAWNQIASWEAHDGPVWKVQWAHPEFGVILASCSFDKRINIWQEKKEEGKVSWVSRAKIQDFSDSVEDICFSPKNFGLKLAACTLNGKMKIFEPHDYTTNINWNCIAQKDVSYGCSSICWNPCPLDPPTLVVACYLDPRKSNKTELLQIYAYHDVKKEFFLLKCLDGHEDTVTDAQWAPVFGRSYHLIASSSLDKKVIIWKIHFKYDLIGEHTNNFNVEYEKFFAIDSNTSIWRVAWNLSGTLLATIDNNGKTYVLKKSGDSFEQIKQIDN